MKLLTVVGARPQFIKEAVFSTEVSKNQDLTEILVHTGQHYDTNMSDVFFENLNIINPHYNLGISGATHASMTGNIMKAFEDVVIKENPDLVVVYGDTNSTLAAALSSVKAHYPVCHIESGVRTNFITNPEEVNRVCVDHISSINCAPTPSCLRNLKLENLKENSFFTGDIMLDAYRKYSPTAENKNFQPLNLNDKAIEIPKEFYYLTCHREENSREETLREILFAMDELDKPVIYPVHPRMKNHITKMQISLSLKNTFFVQPVGYLESLFLLNRATQVITDSGGLQREAFFAEKKCTTLLPFSASEELLAGNRNTLLQNVTKNAILSSMQTPQTIDRTYIPFGTGEAAKEIINIIWNFF